MSGICGIWEPGRRLGASALEPMLQGLLVAAQEEPQQYLAQSVGLGVSRRWDFQGTASFEGVHVVVDADLVDRASIAVSLSLPSQQALNLSTAELIARLYCKCGADCLALLHGAFSIALWDEKQERLILAIDKLGIKSLYWRKESGSVLFASRLRSIRAVQREKPEPNHFAIMQFLLFASVPAPITSDLGTEKLRPGTFLDITQQGVTERTYWDLEYPEEEGKSIKDWSLELREGLRGAVHRHLEASEPTKTGCFLSGGTDSSSVVAFASEKMRPTQSFSIAFNEEAFSEIGFARTTAAAFQTRHHEKFVTPEDASLVLEKILGYFDEPFANSSAVGSYYCAEMARLQGVDTLLSGDGGDELFGGNERYATDKRFALYHEIPKWVRHGLIEPFVRLLPADGGKLSLPSRYIRRANIPNPRRILSYNFFLSHPHEEIFEQDFLLHLRGKGFLSIPEAHFHRASATSELNRILYLDMKMTIADNDLRKVCGTAELAGVNVRYPLLDDQLARLSGRIPARLKLKGFNKRFIFKRAMEGILPTKILRKKKHGFGVPLATWLLQNPKMIELKNDLTADSRTRQRGYFRPGFLDSLTKMHHQQPNFYGEIVWYLLALELWHRIHMDGTRETVHAF
jgi:asparagine synthase (glutamine-hydrolysing)